MNMVATADSSAPDASRPFAGAIENSKTRAMHACGFSGAPQMVSTTYRNFLVLKPVFNLLSQRKWAADDKSAIAWIRY